jgi:segregation and condensation protein A
MEINQKQAFAPIYFRKRAPQASGAMTAPDFSAE